MNKEFIQNNSLEKQIQQSISQLCTLHETLGLEKIYCERYIYGYYSGMVITHFLDNITDNSWLLINIDKEKNSLVEIIKIDKLTEGKSSQPLTNYNDIFRLRDYEAKGQSFYVFKDSIKYEDVSLSFERGRKIKIIGGTRKDCENPNIFNEILNDILVKKIYKPILIQ